MPTLVDALIFLIQAFLILTVITIFGLGIRSIWDFIAAPRRAYCALCYRHGIETGAMTREEFEQHLNDMHILD